MKKTYRLLLLLPLLIVVGYFVGPRVQYDDLDVTMTPLTIPLNELDRYIAQKEAAVPKLKPNNEARIIWAHDTPQKTPYSIVYLHGFSASAEEGAPIHKEVAARYGCNLYLARLAQHGIRDKEIFKNLSPQQLLDSAKEAIAIGKLLGDKVIVMSCSTGSTLSAYLAAQQPAWIDMQLMYAPNFAIENSASKLLTQPWGKQLAYAISGKYRHLQLPEVCHPYWTVQYRVEGIIALQALLDKTMKKTTFQNIKQPTFIAYYYKNEDAKDDVISIDAIHDFYQTIQTPNIQKEVVALPDVQTHVILSALQSKDLESVRTVTFDYLDRYLPQSVRVRTQEKVEVH